MKKFAIVPLVALAFTAACGGDNATPLTAPEGSLFNHSSISVTASVSGSTVSASWSAVSHNVPQVGTREANAYEVLLAPTGCTVTDGSCGTLETVGDATASTAAATSHAFLSVPNGTYTVKARGHVLGSGWGDWKESSSVTVNVAATCTAPDAPTISSNPVSANGDNGWFTTVPTVSASSATAGATISYSTDGENFDASAPTLDEGITTVYAKASTGPNCESGSSREFKVDTQAPEISGSDVNNTTWRNTPLSQNFTASDPTPGSGLANPADDNFTLTASAESADASTPTTVSKTVHDNAGNSSTRTLSALIDLTPPSVSLVGGPAEGSSHYFGSVPAAPTCSASDALSGLASCTITGYSTSVGSHTVKATATDNAGNTTEATASYTVLAWTAQGYYQPVNMSQNFVNTVKGGSTVPLKFQVFAGSTELIATSVIKSFQQVRYTCENGHSEDPVDLVTTGGTSLRYDSTAGQFVQNWQTPKQAGACYRAVVTLQDGSSISASFKLR